MEKTRDRVEQMIGEGLGAAEIAEKLGISRQRVHQIVRAQGWALPRRPFGRSAEASRPAEYCTPVVRTGGIDMKVNSTTAGTIGELLVAADLMARKWVPFLPAVRVMKGPDILAWKDGRVMTVEVRTAYKTLAGKTTFMKRPGDHADVYALVVSGEPVTYEPELPT